MYCPDIKDTCLGESCRDWNKEHRTCRRLLTETKVDKYTEVFQAFVAQYQQEQQETERRHKDWTQYMEKITEANRWSILFSRLSANQMLQAPFIPDETKKIIQQAIEAKNSDIAQKILKDAGLLD